MSDYKLLWNELKDVLGVKSWQRMDTSEVIELMNVLEKKVKK